MVSGFLARLQRLALFIQIQLDLRVCDVHVIRLKQTDHGECRRDVLMMSKTVTMGLQGC
jgi:hypothetical protein